MQLQKFRQVCRNYNSFKSNRAQIKKVDFAPIIKQIDETKSSVNDSTKNVKENKESISKLTQNEVNSKEIELLKLQIKEIQIKSNNPLVALCLMKQRIKVELQL